MSFTWHRLEVVNDTFHGGICSSLVCASPVGPHGTLTVVDDDCENWAKHHHDPANYFRVFLIGPFRNEFDADDADGKNQEAYSRPPPLKPLFRNIKDSYVVHVKFSKVFLSYNIFKPRRVNSCEVASSEKYVPVPFTSGAQYKGPR
jgi:hypothetical protein